MSGGYRSEPPRFDDYRDRLDGPRGVVIGLAVVSGFWIVLFGLCAFACNR